MQVIRRIKQRIAARPTFLVQIGPRCPSYCPGCIICESYHYKAVTGGFPSFNAAYDLCTVATRVEEELGIDNPDVYDVVSNHIRSL